MDCIIIDIDGVLANNTHRLHYIEGKKDYDAFYKHVKDDKPYENIIWLFQKLSEQWWSCRTEFDIFMCSARREDCREDTEIWLETYAHITMKEPSHLLLRKIDDYRPAAEVKSDMIDHIESLGYKIRLFVEDNPDCISMLKHRGITVLDPRTYE